MQIGFCIYFKKTYESNLKLFCIPFKLKHYIIHVHTLSAASYWLFVVNGPTPVVKARIEEEVPNLENEETNWPEIAYRLLKTYFFEVVTKET